MKMKCFRFDCENHSRMDNEGCNLFSFTLMISDDGTLKCWNYKKVEDDK